ncbi:MAG: F0F1 ATP synthase subunit delta [Acidobacteria bacterium]|nr:F0F1 ATP synthase subunit delta [Acidobacteriota bacterium]
MELAVASHYAKAMAELVTRAGSAVPARDAVEQVRSFEDLVASSHDLRGVLLSPAVSGGRKRAIVAKLGGKLGVSPLVLNFLYVIINHRRIGILAEIRQSLEAHIDELMGVVRAEIRSASPLTEPQRYEWNTARMTR